MCVCIMAVVKDMINMQCRQSDRGACVIRAVLYNRGLYNIPICILKQHYVKQNIMQKESLFSDPDSMSVHIALFFVCSLIHFNIFHFACSFVFVHSFVNFFFIVYYLFVYLFF